MTEQDFQEQDAASNAAAATVAEEAEGDGTLVTSTGVKVLPKELPSTLVQRIWAQYPPPKPPMVEMKDGGNVWMAANPMDPDYLEAKSQRVIQAGEATMKLTLLKALDIVELPEGMASYEKDTEWIEEAEAIGLPVPDDKTGRYIEWLRWRVMPTGTDYERINNACMRLAGVTEAEVAAAMDRFPDND